MKNIFNFKVKKIVEKGYNSTAEVEVLNVPKVVVFGVIGLFILITIFSSFTTVKSGEVGLKVRFGRITDSSITEGINFKIPYVDKIAKVNIKVQKAEMAIESSTKDLQIVNTNIAVNYRIDPEKASYLYKTVGNAYEETVLNPAIKESIKTAIAQYTAEEITVNRNEVSESCLKAIQEKVLKYGIVIEDFNLTDFGFSEAYSQAIEEKQVAEQNKQKAELEAQAKIVQAQAEKEANDLLRQTLTEEVLIQQFIEKWNGQLPSTYAGEDILGLFNLN